MATGHWNICLDYRGGRSAPCVTYVDMEFESQEHVANTFAEYLLAKRLQHFGCEEPEKETRTA